MSDEGYSLTLLDLKINTREDFARRGWIGEREILESDGFMKYREIYHSTIHFSFIG
jgi:hypothetical protein